MKTVVAETVLFGKEAFETLGDVAVVPDRQIRPEHLKDADALIIRSKTNVTAELLEGSAVRFAGTATAGFEHMDTAALDARGVAWTAAPGCNADSVADYITAALLHLSTRRGIPLEGRTLGIIGAGQVGLRVARRASALGLRVLLNDPPRAAREGNKQFTELPVLLAESDIVTLHVPLVAEPPWPTLRLADERFFARMKPGAVFINTARGRALDGDALRAALSSGNISQAVLDVWDPEPGIRTDLLAATAIGTPHIAGYSYEGRLNGTVQVYREACRVVSAAPVWHPAPPAPPDLELDPSGKSDLEVLAEAARAVYDIAADDAALRAAAAAGEARLAASFDRLRSAYRERREFGSTRIVLAKERPALAHRLRTAGFRI